MTSGSLTKALADLDTNAIEGGECEKIIARQARPRWEVPLVLVGLALLLWLRWDAVLGWWGR